VLGNNQENLSKLSFKQILTVSVVLLSTRVHSPAGLDPEMVSSIPAVEF